METIKQVIKRTIVKSSMTFRYREAETSFRKGDIAGNSSENMDVSDAANIATTAPMRIGIILSLKYAIVFYLTSY